ncbi:uncharacterized protein L201_007518 [Kwoniella dendrophila CBS 6074]|uniref:Glycoprotein n=1 Tax=Kwoniella dendrophila CBS 6074 TaxID=1295534 RepID=A0AAX4K601_9TREE
MFALIPLLALLPSLTSAQVTASFPNGATNPEKPEFYPIGSYVNSTSVSRLITLNGVDDFCLWGPPDQSGDPKNEIGNIEPVVVAYCTKPRNGARLIPDGAITGAHFIKTPTYVQIHGFWDGTKVGIVAGDSGGELDPHGAENLGNPIGGNVTSNVEGKDVFYEEWMSFISYDQFCLRVCTAETSNVSAALQCEHELDIMGCQFVMAIENFYQSNNTFSSCEGEPAAPPGLYPQAGGGYSTFRQRYTQTDAAGQGLWTVGNTVTPSTVAFYPKTSNCNTYSTISNGVNTGDWAVTATPVVLVSGSTQTATVGSTSQSKPSGASAAASTGSASGASSGASGSSASASASRSGSSAGASASAGASGSTNSSNAAAGTSGARLTAQGSSANLIVGAGVAAVGVLVGAVSFL